MSAEPQNECHRQRDELLLLACGDVAPSDLSPATRDHLAECARCRASLDESRDLITAVREALRPTPLTPTLQHRIQDRIDAVTFARRRGGLRRLQLVWTAAAACLLTAMFAPQVSRPHAGLELVITSERDAAEIVAAFSLLHWNAPLDYSIYQVEALLSDLGQTLDRAPGTSSLLPWEPGDDWDVPVRDDEPSEGSRRRSSRQRRLQMQTAI